MKEKRTGSGKTPCLLIGGVFLCCAALIDPASILRSISTGTPPAPISTGTPPVPVVTWPRIDSFIPAAARADHPQRRDDLRTSVVIEDFDSSAPGGFPSTWKAWRGDDDLARNTYSIREEGGNRYLHAADDGSSIIIRKRLGEWDANEYPVLSWRWRARVLPEDGDERIGSRNDSSVAVYVVLDQNFIGVPKTLKYVWSTTLPVGTYHRRDGVGRPHVIVLESGKEKLGQWVEESVDVHADYVRIFGKKPPREAVGIGVLTDGNATGTDSQGDYDDFVVHRRNTGP